MISTTLPYSNQRFKIKKITFEQVIDISHIIGDGTDSDLIEYLEEFFEIEHLSVIDKFYVMVKAREVFINETISVTANDNNITKINLSILLDKIVDLPNRFTVLTNDSITFDLDMPYKFALSNNNLEIYDSVIRRLKIHDVILDYAQLKDKDRNTILESLPPTLFKGIKEYIDSLDLTLTLFDGKKALGIEPIVVNFLSNDPAYIIKALYSEYDVQTCREMIFYLSQKIGETILLKSTMMDITMYINEISTQNERAKGSNSVLEL
jgi:hypothetical protein